MVVQRNPFLSYDTGYPDKHLISEPQQVESVMRFMADSPAVVFDFETSGLDWWAHSEPCGIALAGWTTEQQPQYFYLPYRHRTGELQFEFEAIREPIGRLLADQSKMKIAHNLKFDEHMARREGWHVRGPRYDTLIAARFHDENMPLALEYRAVEDLGRPEAYQWKQNLDREIVRLARLNGMKKAEYRGLRGYSEVAIPICGTYACHDVDYTLGLYSRYEQEGLSQRYPRVWDTEMRLTEVVCDMEEAGLPINVEYLENLRATLQRVKRDLGVQIERLAGRRLDIGSDDKLRQFMIDDLGLRWTKMTKGQKLSVDADQLREFSTAHPSIPLILKWRTAEKLLNTYTTSILKRLDQNNVLHANFQQHGTNTGRFSCKEPNFQNQPSDDDDRAVEHSGKSLEDGGVDPWSIRRAFVNRGKNWVRLFYDYSQIELRVLAFYSRDPVMVDNYLKNGDIHSRTSQEVFGSTEKKFRRISKVINFGLSYCLTELGLSRQADLPMEEAERFMAEFFRRYHGVAEFRQRFWAQVRAQNGEFQNIFGRPRRVRGINSRDGFDRGRAERQAIATLIQGTAAELTKESLVRVSDRLRAEGLPAMIVNCVHDEIQTDTEIDSMVEVCRVHQEEMERYPEFQPIPIVVDGEYTVTSWADKIGLPRVNP